MSAVCMSELRAAPFVLGSAQHLNLMSVDRLESLVVARSTAFVEFREAVF